jgi:transcriptional regulator
VYVPDHFQAPDEDVRALLEHLDAADLITPSSDGLLATFLPLLYEPPGASSDAGEHGRLMGHVARNNRHWTTPATGEALVIVRGPEAYVSPAWYATKAVHGRVVPTWNYVTAHVHGELVVHDDRDWVERNVRALVLRHEGRRPAPWSVDDAPSAYVEGQLRAIVGVEVRITRIEAKLKLSQNRSKADVEGAIDGLLAEGDARATATAEAMQAIEISRDR